MHSLDVKIREKCNDTFLKAENTRYLESPGVFSPNSGGQLR